jgi:hypothetical protein
MPQKAWPAPIEIYSPQPALVAGFGLCRACLANGLL